MQISCASQLCKKNCLNAFPFFLVKWVYHKLYIFQFQIFATNWPSLLYIVQVYKKNIKLGNLLSCEKSKNVVFLFAINNSCNILLQLRVHLDVILCILMPLSACVTVQYTKEYILTERTATPRRHKLRRLFRLRWRQLYRQTGSAIYSRQS